MKKFFVAAVLLFACAQAFGQLVITQRKDEPAEKEKSFRPAIMDFRPYTANGFFLSTSSYSGDYTPVGYLELQATPETVKNKNRKLTDPLYLVEEIPVSELLDAAVEAAKAAGADGIIDLKITPVAYTTAGSEIVVSPPVKYYLVTGLCISRAKAGND